MRGEPAIQEGMGMKSEDGRTNVPIKLGQKRNTFSFFSFWAAEDGGCAEPLMAWPFIFSGVEEGVAV